MRCNLKGENGVEDMLKIAFFFGAGAEGNGNFGISSGFEFMKKSLFSKEHLRGYLDGLKNHFEIYSYFDNKYKYRTDTLCNDNLFKKLLENFVFQKAENDKAFMMYT